MALGSDVGGSMIVRHEANKQPGGDCTRQVVHIGFLEA
jgi:hypothetical protein